MGTPAIDSDALKAGLAAVRRGECPFCRLETPHPQSSRCPRAGWFNFLRDCRSRVREIFRLNLDDYLSIEELKDCFERGDQPTQVVFRFIEEAEKRERF